MGWPSSAVKWVTWRAEGTKSGPSAIHTFRLPFASNTHATRLPWVAATRPPGKGELIICSRVNGDCADTGVVHPNITASDTSKRALVNGIGGKGKLRLVLLPRAMMTER